MALSLQHIAHVLGSEVKTDSLIRELAFDTRRILDPKHALFFALAGKRDGHSFLDEAYEAGVRYFVVEKGRKLPELKEAEIIAVESPINAMQRLASEKRRELNGPLVGITGSNGKTLVKEWLFHLFKNQKAIDRSPKSYNSQLGVALSLWGMQSDKQLYLLEAGISKEGEMEALERMLQPEIGILSSFGAAHDEGFVSRKAKLLEKLRLFEKAEVLIYSKDDEFVQKETAIWSEGKGIKLQAWSLNGEAEELNFKAERNQHKSVISYGDFQFEIPFTDQASIENFCTCLSFAISQNLDLELLKEQAKSLPGIDMRLQLKKGKFDSQLINDAYSADLSSLEIALDFLERQAGNHQRVLVLSDLQEAGKNKQELYTKIKVLLQRHPVQHFIGVGPDFFLSRPDLGVNSLFFESTAQILEQLDLNLLKNKTILIKGAREFQFEKLVRAWEDQVHETALEINLNALEQNFSFFKSRLNPKTRIMAMVKAHGYGSGSHEIAHQLQSIGADYLSVAYADEGIELRKKGISLPIMVMNSQRDSLEEMLDFGLEPAIYDFSILNKLIQTLRETGIKSAPVHLEFDTGMHRLGFEKGDVDNLISILRENPAIEVKSVFAHLAASDEAVHDGFTQKQLEEFSALRLVFEQNLPNRTLFHILNTAGILRFPQAQNDMVRLGIGLYGIDPAGEFGNLQAVSSLMARISQIRGIKQGDTVGYSRKGVIHSDSQIAVLSIGYADGLRRNLSNGIGRVYINGYFAPIIGNICMDMTMVDVTHIPCKEGDAVEIFGPNLAIEELAEKSGTIAYEILTGVAQRVKRIYWKE